MKIKNFIFFILFLCMPIMAHADEIKRPICSNFGDEITCTTESVCKWEGGTCKTQCNTGIDTETPGAFSYNSQNNVLTQTYLSNTECLKENVNFFFMCVEEKETVNKEQKTTYKWKLMFYFPLNIWNSADPLGKILNDGCSYTVIETNEFIDRYTFEKCDDNKKMTADRTECQACADGKICNGITETDCPAGYACSGGKKGDKCPDGTYSDNGSCNGNCGAGSYIVYNKVESDDGVVTELPVGCNYCEAGHFCPGQTEPTKNTSDWFTWNAYKTNNNKHFIPNHKYPCPRGFYQTGPGATSCFECPTGYTTSYEGSTSSNCVIDGEKMGFKIDTEKKWSWPTYMKVLSTNWDSTNVGSKSKTHVVGSGASLQNNNMTDAMETLNTGIK